MAMINDRNTATNLFNFFHIMGSINDCRSLTVQFYNPFQDPVPALWIDSYRWFVHDDKLWLVGNTAGNVESSKKTAGQFSGTFFCIFRKPHKIQCFVHQLFTLLLVSYIQTTEIVYIFPDTHLMKYSHILHDNTNLFFDIVTVRGHVFAKDLNRTFVIFQQRQHTADRSGFSRAVWSQKSKNLPFFNVQVQVIQCNQITISFYKIFNMDHRKFLQFLVLRLAYFLLVIINVLCL